MRITINNIINRKMKKEYLTPEVQQNLISLEVNFLTSGDPSQSGSENLIFDDPVSPWIF